MADAVLSIASDMLVPLIVEAANTIRGVPMEVSELKEELQLIQAMVQNADRMADDEEDRTSEEIKRRVQLLIEATFRLEDAIDEYEIYEERAQQSRERRCAGLTYDPIDFIKTVTFRLRITRKIQRLKDLVRSLKHGLFLSIQSFLLEEPASSRENRNNLWQNLRWRGSREGKAEIIGIEAPRDALVGWLVEGTRERTVICVVGVGGGGKSTLAKTVFDHRVVSTHFDSHAWITVSQSYTVEGVLRKMLKEFYREEMKYPPQDIFQMDGEALKKEVRSYLYQKRYVVFFDDVWDIHFWDEIEFVAVNNKNGSRIFITTRNTDVANSSKKSSLVNILKLSPLTHEKSWQLFCNKAFQFEFDGFCPQGLQSVSLRIVEKCAGNPLAIVLIGGLMSHKANSLHEFEHIAQYLSSKLQTDSYLPYVTTIIRFCYDELPVCLKSCFLYFGLYPDDYEVESRKLIRQWIAEGFVIHEVRKTLEETGEEYLLELISRGLVQVSSFSVDGKVKSCRVHNLIRYMILRKGKDLKFCHYVSEDTDQLSGITRRLSIATNLNDRVKNIECSFVRSLLFFTNEELSEHFFEEIPTKYKLLKVLDFENTQLYNVPKDLGNLLYLRYLSFRNTQVERLPESIGMLQNLETLDLRETRVYEMPKEISKLQKLRHLLATEMSLIQLMGRIEGMKYLQTLKNVEVSDDENGEQLISQLACLKDLRNLGLLGITKEHEDILCFLLSEARYLEKLLIAFRHEEVVDLEYSTVLPSLYVRKLHLQGKLHRLPGWVQELHNLVKLTLTDTKLEEDPVKPLKDLRNLVYLCISYEAYCGGCLYFEEGCFRKLKELRLENLRYLEIISIDRGALSSLEKLTLLNLPRLRSVPRNVHYLESLQHLNIWGSPMAFADGGEDYRINSNVRVNIIG